MNRQSKLVVANAAWLISGIGLAAAMGLFGAKTGYSVMGFYLWFIIPAGAIIAGLISGAFYYLISLGLHFRPGAKSPMPIVMAATVVPATYGFLTFFILADIGRSRVWSVSKSVDFMMASLTETSYSLGQGTSSTSFNVGAFGYVLFAIELAGFVAGSFLVVKALRNKPWSELGDQYFRKVKSTSVKFNDVGVMQAETEQLKGHINAGRVDEAFACMTSMGGSRKGSIAVVLTHHRVDDTGEIRLNGVINIGSGKQSQSESLGLYQTPTGATPDQTSDSTLFSSSR